MTELKCPSCGSSNVEQIDANRYQCPYCGNTFNSSSIMPPRSICIHGYTQWFAINPDVKIYINGQLVGKVGKGENLQVNIESPSQFKFECNMRSAKVDVDPSVDTDIYISWDRISGCLLVNKQNDANGSTSDKPNIALDILSFLIPIAGVILYFVKKSDYPNSAKAYLICAICGFGLGLILSLM